MITFTVMKSECRYLCYLIGTLSLVFSCQGKEETTSICLEKNSQLLQQLDQTLEMVDTYDSYFNTRVNQYRKMLEDETNLYNIEKCNYKLSELFTHHCLDSALFYLDRTMDLAKQAHNSTVFARSELTKAYLYALGGYYIEAGDVIGRYDLDKLPEECRFAYFQAARKLSFELRIYSMNGSHYLNSPDNFRSDLLKYVKKGSFEWHEILREEAFCNGDIKAQEEHVEKMFELTDEGSNRYATACYYKSTLLRSQPEEELCWLLKSAISDVMSSTKDYQSLLSISLLLYSYGDIEHAFDYIVNHCLPDAILYNGKLRAVQVSKILPKIEKRYQEKLQYEKGLGHRYMIALIILVIILVVLMGSLNRRNQKLIKTKTKLYESKIKIESQNEQLVEMNGQLRNLNFRMKEANQVKEEYISLFLCMLSDDINTSRKYKNHVLKHLRRGNSQEIIHEIEQLPPIDEDINQFYKMFDETFINMYPDFVTRFNRLLQPGEEILPKTGELMTPDHRIYALIKLGISDSGKIAALLHYSPNTIYNYKARVKNKAKGNRETFDEQVKNLYTVEEDSKKSPVGS